MHCGPNSLGWKNFEKHVKQEKPEKIPPGIAITRIRPTHPPAALSKNIVVHEDGPDHEDVECVLTTHLNLLEGQVLTIVAANEMLFVVRVFSASEGRAVNNLILNEKPLV